MTPVSSTLAIAALGGAIALASPPALSAQEIGLPLGTRAQPVEVDAVEGGTVDLADFLGKQPVLIEFWATWCSLCEELAPTVEAAYTRFGDEVAFITVAVGVSQSIRSIRRHLEDHPIPGLVVYDDDGDAVSAFKAPGTSYVVVLDADGRVVYTGSGGQQDLEGALAKVVSDG